jgi:hypothetical protein
LRRSFGARVEDRWHRPPRRGEVVPFAADHPGSGHWCRQRLANRLKTAGCAVDLTGLDWHTAGNLTPPVAAGGLPIGKKMPKADLPTEPRLKARYVPRGKNAMGEIQVTNHGLGDIFET